MLLPRFYPILDIDLLTRLHIAPLTAAESLIDAGAGILQLRQKGHYSRQLVTDARQIADLCRARGVLFIVNDRADIAMLLDAGLHVGQDDLPPTEARTLIGPTQWLGFSTHNAKQLLAARDEPADYLALGPIFATSSKDNPDPVVGIDELRRLRRLTEKPLVAIGGITLDRAAEVLAAGADSIAVIGDLYRDPSALRQHAERWLRATA